MRVSLYRILLILIGFTTVYQFLFILQHEEESSKDRSSNNISLPGTTTHNNNRTTSARLPSSSSTTQPPPPLNKLVHVGQYGLGHRLSKLAAAHHLAAAQLNLPVLQVHWGKCGLNDQEIFAHLFGSNTIAIRNENTTSMSDRQGKIVLVRNDVLGYYAGQSYKNAARVIPSKYVDDKNDNNPWFHKIKADASLFQKLLNKFTGRRQVQAFQAAVGWHNHTVIGLHIRAGNGERHHFTAGQRDMRETNPEHYVTDLMKLIDGFLKQPDQMLTSIRTKQPMIFLATDSVDWIALVQNATNMPVYAFPQPRLAANHGVSYQRWTVGRQCLDGWMSAATDMALLAQSDVLVAARRSTFTQILPMSVVLDRNNHGRFCEVASSGRTMTCFRDYWTWLFRNHNNNAASHQMMRTLSLDANNNNQSMSSVVHKVMVHLPDLDVEPKLQNVKTFLHSAVQANQSSSSTAVFAYGDRISKKYRGKENRVFREEWTAASTER